MSYDSPEIGNQQDMDRDTRVVVGTFFAHGPQFASLQAADLEDTVVLFI